MSTTDCGPALLPQATTLLESPDAVAVCLTSGVMLLRGFHESRSPLAHFERWVEQCRDFALPMVQKVDDLVTQVAQLPKSRAIEALEVLRELRELIAALQEALWKLVFMPLRAWRFSVAMAAALALGMNDGETLDRFAREFLGLSLNSNEQRADVRRAIYLLLRTSSGWWRKVEAEGVFRYLRIAVKREAARLRTDREKEGRLWGWRKNAPAVVYAMDAEMPAPVEQSDPALLFDHQEELRTRRAIIAELRGSHLPSDQDQLLTLMEAGVPAAEAVEIVGNGCSPYQAFQRKARRRLAQRDAEERRRVGV